MDKSITAYPLQWPPLRARTRAHMRERAKFGGTFATCRDELVNEVMRLKYGSSRYADSRAVVISTNIALRMDGLPLANQRQAEDPGVAVYFEHRGKQMCFACDRWQKVEHNMRAIAKTIEALRGVERWGTGSMVEAAFEGFVKLPAPTAAKPWRDVLQVAPLGSGVTLAAARDAYRRLAFQYHPDRGGSEEKMAEVNAAWEQAQRELPA